MSGCTTTCQPDVVTTTVVQPVETRQTVVQTAEVARRVVVKEPLTRNRVVTTPPSTSATTTVVDPQEVIQIVGRQGPPGPPGPAGDVTPAPSMANTDIMSLVPGTAVTRYMGGYASADAQLSNRWQVVGLIGGDTPVPVGQSISPQPEGVLVLTVAQWEAALSTPGGLAPGRTYYLGNQGQLTLTPPTSDGTTIVPVGVAAASDTLHIRINVPVFL